MYTIKKYANGRFYDTVEKNYLTREQISDLVNAKKKIEIIDTQTNADITSEILSKSASRKQKAAKPKASKKTKSRKNAPDTANILVQLFRKGGGHPFRFWEKRRVHLAGHPDHIERRN